MKLMTVFELIAEILKTMKSGEIRLFVNRRKCSNLL